MQAVPSDRHPALLPEPRVSRASRSGRSVAAAALVSTLLGGRGAFPRPGSSTAPPSAAVAPPFVAPLANAVPPPRRRGPAPPLPSRLSETGLYAAGARARLTPTITSTCRSIRSGSTARLSAASSDYRRGAHRRFEARSPGVSGGTRWKEFSFCQPAETRLIERLPDGGFRYATTSGMPREATLSSPRRGEGRCRHSCRNRARRTLGVRLSCVDEGGPAACSASTRFSCRPIGIRSRRTEKRCRPGRSIWTSSRGEVGLAPATSGARACSAHHGELRERARCARLPLRKLRPLSQPRSARSPSSISTWIRRPSTLTARRGREERRLAFESLASRTRTIPSRVRTGATEGERALHRLASQDPAARPQLGEGRRPRRPALIRDDLRALVPDPSSGSRVAAADVKSRGGSTESPRPPRRKRTAPRAGVARRGDRARQHLVLPRAATAITRAVRGRPEPGRARHVAPALGSPEALA